MAKKYFKWTPEALDRLRQLGAAMYPDEIAAALGCTRVAAATKMCTEGIQTRTRAERDAVRSYMLAHHVSRRRVNAIGLARLGKMSEEARALVLRPRAKAVKAKPAVPQLSKTQRIERMMQLSRKVA